jgi:hypothetical protein
MSALAKEALAIEASPVRRRKVWKWLLGIFLVLVAAGSAAQLTYTYSGSRQWEFVTESNGVKVYSQKIPGVNNKKFLAIYTLKASLGSVVAFMQDSDSDLDIDFDKSVELERRGPQMMVTTWRSGFPNPLSDRDFVVRHVFTQNPLNKEISYTLQSLPDLIPKNSCCVRVPRMDNSWLLMPKAGGQVEIRWFIDMDVGGFMPYFMINEAHPEIMVDFASKMQGYVSRAKYANAKQDWISEL